MLLQHFDEAILRGMTSRVNIVPLNPRFEIRGGYISLREEGVFRRRPAALLELFLLMAQHPEIEGVRRRHHSLHCVTIVIRSMTPSVTTSVTIACSWS